MKHVICTALLVVSVDTEEQSMTYRPYRRGESTLTIRDRLHKNERYLVYEVEQSLCVVRVGALEVHINEEKNAIRPILLGIQ